MGQSPPSSTVNEAGHGLPFVQGNAEFGSRHPQPVKFCTEPKRRAQAGDILLSVRAPVGALNLTDKALCIGRGLSAITATRVDASFLWHALRREASRLVRVSQGSTFAAVNKDDLHGLEIPLPSLPEQRKIAAILSSVDDAIEKTQSIINQVQVVKRGLMQELLTRGLPGRHKRFKQMTTGRVPVDWEFRRLWELAEPRNGIQTGPFGSQLHASEYVEFGVPVIMPKDMVDGRISDVDSARISEEKARELSHHRVQPGDILFARRGDLGRTALVTQHENGWICGTGCIRFRPSHEPVSRFLRHWIEWPGSVRWLQDHAVGQTMLNLNRSIVGLLPVALPSESEQLKISGALEALARQTGTLRREVNALDTMKRSLMRVLLTGELRVTPEADKVKSGAGPWETCRQEKAHARSIT